MPTLEGDITAQQAIIVIASPPDSVRRGSMIRIEDEVMELRGYRRDFDLWSVRRGRAGTAAVAHPSGAEVQAATDAHIAGAFTAPPGPFDSAGLDEAAHDALDHTGLTGVGGGLPRGWTQDAADPANVASNDGDLALGSGKLTADTVDITNTLALAPGTSIDTGGGNISGANLFLDGGGEVSGSGIKVVGLASPTGPSDAVDLATLDARIPSVAFQPDGAALLKDPGTDTVGWYVLANIVAAGVPSGAPSTGQLPIAYDSTPSTGGLYIWNGAAWVKVANIL